MQVYVLVFNDVPESVFANEEEAILHGKAMMNKTQGDCHYKIFRCDFKR